MAILIICGTIAFKVMMDHFWPITTTSNVTPEHCINQNGVPVNRKDVIIIDCNVYKIVAEPTLTPTPIAGQSATPTYIPIRTSSASANNL